MPLIQLFVATHNRPLLVVNAVSSILKQSFSNFELIISDNSTNDETRIALSVFNDPRLKYIRREPGLNVIEHLNAILKEVIAEYFMIFHDDDTMHSNMLEILYNRICERKEIVAIGANARVIENGKLKRKYFHPKLRSDVTIHTRDEIIKAYSIPGIVPFPSYLYRKQVAIKLKFNTENGGKYCDAAFIFDLLTLGSIIFVAEPLMDYNKHGNQDSKIYELNEGQKLIDYITKTSKYHSNHILIRRFRVQNVYDELKYLVIIKNISILSKEYGHLIKVLFKYSFTEYFFKIILLTFYYKISHIFRFS